jgi:hypothetical protein
MEEDTVRSCLREILVAVIGGVLAACLHPPRHGALGFRVPVGMYPLLVRNRGRSFIGCVTIREDEEKLLRVAFPPQRLLLEFGEDVAGEVTAYIDDVPTPLVVRGRRVCEVEVAPGRREIVVRHGMRVFRRVFVVATRPCATLAVDLDPQPPAAPFNPPATGRKEPDSNGPLPSRSQARPARETRKPVDVWRAGRRLLGKRVVVQGEGRVFRNLDDQLIVRFYKGQTAS